MKTILTISEAAAIAGVSRQYLHKLIDQGRLPSRRVGPLHTVKASDLSKIERLKPGPKALRRSSGQVKS